MGKKYGYNPFTDRLDATKDLTETITINNLKIFQLVTPATDGATVIFTTPDAYVANTLQVFRDQSSLQKGATKDFTETSPSAGTFTLASAPDADEDLWVHYIKA